MNNEKFESFIDDRFSSLKNLTLYIQDLEYTSYDLKQLKDYLRIAILEKAKENVRIIKEDSFIETFFLMHSISLENLKYIQRISLQIIQNLCQDFHFKTTSEGTIREISELYSRFFQHTKYPEKSLEIQEAVIAKKFNAPLICVLLKTITNISRRKIRLILKELYDKLDELINKIQNLKPKDKKPIIKEGPLKFLRPAIKTTNPSRRIQDRQAILKDNYLSTGSVVIQNNRKSLNFLQNYSMISENEKEIDQKTQGCMSTSEEKKNQFNSTLQKIYPKEQIVLFNHEKVKIELKKTLEKPIKLEKIFNIKEMKKYEKLVFNCIEELEFIIFPPKAKNFQQAFDVSFRVLLTRNQNIKKTISKYEEKILEKFKNPQDFRIFLKETQESLKNNNNYKNSNNDCMETTPIIFKIKSGRFQTNRNIQNKNVKNLRYLSMSSKKKQKILNIYGENLYNKSSVQTNINSLQSFGCPSLSKDETSLKIYDNSNSDHRKTRNYFEDRNRKLQLNEKNANAKLKDYINRNIYYIK